MIGGSSSNTSCTGFGSSINCTTTGSSPTYISGTAGIPGGIVNRKSIKVYDCKDDTYATYEQKKLRYGWEKFDPEETPLFFKALWNTCKTEDAATLEGLPAIKLKL